MKPRFSFRKFLHTRLGILVWTLLVALIAFDIGLTLKPTAKATSITAPRISI